MSQNIPLGWAPIQPNLKLRKAGKLSRKFSTEIVSDLHAIDPSWLNGSQIVVSY